MRSGRRSRWIGRAITGVGMLHSVYALIDHDAAFRAMVQDGLVGAVEGHPDRTEAFWFLISGLLTICVGSLVHQLETVSVQVPTPFALGFLLLAVLAIVAVPTGGAWLLLIPAVGVMMKR